MITTAEGVWLVASLFMGRPVLASEPYPCLCLSQVGCDRRRNLNHCWCWGRSDDLSHLPRACCAVRAAARARLSRNEKKS